MAHPNEPLPLFSPTQVGCEQVLHSIFSPTLEGGVTSFNKKKSKEANRETQKRERMAQAAKRVMPKTPSSSIKKKENVFNAAQQHSPDDEFYSPVGHVNDAPFIPATITKAGLKTPANLAKSAFQSPMQTTTFSAVSSSPALSTISALTTASSCSFKSVPIDMLSFEFVKSCDSPESLQQIVTALSADGSKHHYPSLLRTATTQLQSIHERKSTSEDHVVVPSVRFSDDKESMLYVSSVKDESSLALSLSSSMLDGPLFENVPSTSNDEIPDKTSERKTQHVMISSETTNHQLSNTTQTDECALIICSKRSKATSRN